MSEGTEFLRAGAGALVMLNGGGAPLHWQRSLRGFRAGPRALRRASRWALGIMGHYPTLFDAPLWGDCLAQLVGRQPAASATHVGQGSRGAANAPPGVRRVPRPRAAESRHERSSHARPESSGFDKHVEEGRLEEDVRTRDGGGNSFARSGRPAPRTSARAAGIGPPSVPARQTTPEPHGETSAWPTREASAPPPKAQPFVGPSGPGAIDEGRTPQEQQAPARHSRQTETAEASDVQPGRRAQEPFENVASSGPRASVDAETERAEIAVAALPHRASAELLSLLLATEDVAPTAQPQTPRLDEPDRAPVARQPTGHIEMRNAGQPNAQSSSRATLQQTGQGAGISFAAPPPGDVYRRRAGAVGDNVPAVAAKVGAHFKPNEVGARFKPNRAASARLNDLTRLASSERHGAASLDAEFRAGEVVMWLAELAGRAGHIVRGGIRLPAAAQAGDASELLCEQWALSLQGETAPSALLSALAAGARVEALTNAGPVRAKTNASSPGGAAARVPAAHLFSGPDVATGVAEPRPSATHAPHAAEKGAPELKGNTRADGAAPGRTSTHAHRRPEALYTDAPALSRTDVPGSHAPELPPLLPAQTTTEAVLPVAVETARQGARVEAQRTAQPDEPTAGDLDLLAEKIKLILDEQARRHGIDV